MIISNEQVALIQGALDSMALALTEYGHTFTAGERAIYEEATEALKNRDYGDRVEALEKQLAQANATLLNAENLRAQAMLVVRAADILEEYLGRNTGTTADWPIEIKGDQDSAPHLTNLLQELVTALKPYRVSKV